MLDVACEEVGAEAPEPENVAVEYLFSIATCKRTSTLSRDSRAVEYVFVEWSNVFVPCGAKWGS